MIFSTLKHLVHVFASSDLLYVVCHLWYIEKVRSNSRTNESWNIVFQFCGILDRGRLSDFPEIPTTEQNSKLSCNDKSCKCSLYKTCSKCPPPSAPEDLSIHGD